MRGDKIGLIGANGTGKTTLLKLILGEIQPDSGSVRLGTKIQVAYFDQLRAALDEEATLADTIRASADFIPELSLVAEIDGRVVGHVMISGATLRDEAMTSHVANLSPLAVLPDFQRRGIGTALVREVTARADGRGEPVVILEGSPAFYGRLGFEPSVPLGIHITLPSWAPAEAAQVLRMSTYSAAIRGRVVYPPAFDEAEERRHPQLGGDQAAGGGATSANVSESISASHDAVMTFSPTPMVVHERSPSVESIRTRVMAAVPAAESRTRTL